MNSRTNIRYLTLLLWLLMTPFAAADAPVTVFAAASLKGALDDVATKWDGPVTLSYAGSGATARQVAQGAPADVVILANSTWMQWLSEERRLLDQTDLLGNRLVLIGTKDATPISNPDPSGMLARLNGRRMAIGQTQSVPAGIYGRAWMQAAGLWPALATHLAETENVRVALALVARGETPLGLVYASDATAEPRVSVVYHIDPATHPAITFPAAALTDSGQRFLAFLKSDATQSIFSDHGFLPPPVAE